MKAQNKLAVPSASFAPASSWVVGLNEEMVKKQQAFYEARVKHPAMQTLVDDLMPLLMPYSESNIIAITGATGAGKSTLTRVLLKSLFADFAQLMQEDPSTIPLISVEAYSNGETRHGFKGLYQSMLEQLAEPGTKYKAPATIVDGRLFVQPRSRETIDGLRRIVESGMRERRTRICVIDEAAHLLRFKKDSVAMDTLKSLSNTTGVKWVLVGSFDLFDLISDHGQLARRANLLNFERYRVDVQDDRVAFKEVIEKLETKWPCHDVPNFQAISDELLEVSMGCIGLLKSFLLDASAMQLRAGGKWDQKFLAKAAKSSKLRDVIRKEIEVGEAKVRNALYGNSIWTNEMVSKLAHKMEATRA